MSKRYKDLCRQVDIEKKTRNAKRIADAVNEANGSYAWMKKVAQLGVRHGEVQRPEISLPEHVEASLTAVEQAEDIATFISKISREYIPLSHSSLPTRVTDALDNEDL